MLRVESKHLLRVHSTVTLALIVAVYVIVGSLYAIQTPLWQVPDEPAHYNYIRALASGQGLPILEPGDYDQVLLSKLTSQGFPSELSIDRLEYEDHQPPLYYLLSVPIYRVFHGAVLPLRLFSVALGAGVLLAAFLVVRVVFPERTELALRTVAFIAFIPQHVAMMAGINNDALGELAVALVLWMTTIYVFRKNDRPWFLGVLLGIALLSKTTAYPVLVVVVLAALLRWRIERRSLAWLLRQMGWLFIPSSAISAPWFARNGIAYGWLDPLGLVRHSQIVSGQPRTIEWLMTYGWWGLLAKLGRTTFQSFWGQFGWMGVLLPVRIYQVLAIFSEVLLLGFAWWIVDPRRVRLSREQRVSLVLLAISAILTVTAFAWYNRSFVQHQGRYLFPALVPVGLAVALALDEESRLLPSVAVPWAVGGMFGLFALFDVYCLYGVILPGLMR